MRSFSSYTTTAYDSPHVDLIRLAKIELSGLTLYVCDRKFGDTDFEFDSQIYEPVVLSWGPIELGRAKYLYHEGGEPGTTNFVIDNRIPIGGSDKFTDLFTFYKPTYGVVTMYDLPNGASSSSDLAVRFKGHIEDIDMEVEEVTLHCTTKVLAMINKFSVEVCDQDTYASADPDDYGKIFPIVYGSAKRVPFIAVDAGSMTNLTANIDNSQTYLPVSDASKFPATGATIQVNLEKMTYSSTTATQLVGVVRGYDSTDAVPHSMGAIVAELQSEYFYVLGHPVSAIDGVYVINRNNDENVLQDPSLYDTYTGQTGDEHASYPGKAVIKFNTIPSIDAQINLEIEDNIDVDDQIGVVDPTHGHGADEIDYEVYEFEDAVFTVGAGGAYDIARPDHLANIVGGDIVSNSYMQGQGTNIRLSKVFVQDSPGQISKYRVCMHINFLDTNCGARAKFMASDTFNQTSLGTFKGNWWDYSGTWTNFTNQYADCWRTGTNAGGYAFIGLVWVEIQIEDFITPEYSGTYKYETVYKVGTVELIGNSVADTVIGGAVSADISGYRADDSGNYGATNSLIERPDYIMKHFLVNYCGADISNDFGSSYSTSGTQYLADSVTLAVVILERPDLLEFLEKVSFQSKSLQYWDRQQHQLVYLPYEEITDKTIEKGRIDTGSVKIYYMARTLLKNTWKAMYEKHWIGPFDSDVESFRSVIKEENSVSVSEYGTLEGEVIELEYVMGEIHAQRMLSRIGDEYGYPVLSVEFVGGHYLADFEIGDVFSFKFDPDDELDQQLLGLVVSEVTQFRVIGISETEQGDFGIIGHQVVSSTTSSGVFYPGANPDDGYDDGTFYNNTNNIIIGNNS